MVPSIPYRIVTTVRVGTALRQETRNATTLPQAMAIAEREANKPHTRQVEVLCCLYVAARRGGVVAVNGAIGSFASS